MELEDNANGEAINSEIKRLKLTLVHERVIRECLKKRAPPRTRTWDLSQIVKTLSENHTTRPTGLGKWRL
jgi:hypothetical protein